MPKRHQRNLKPREPKGSTTVASAVIESQPEQAIRAEASSGAAPAVKWRGIYALVPAVIAFISSLNSLWNYFASDDLEQVLNNPMIKDLGNLPAAFTSSVWSFTTSDIVFTVDPYFRPIFTSLFTLNYGIFGTTPLGWHLVNVLIHTGVTLLVFVVAREVTEQNWVALLTAALFAVHPTHAESVAWVSGITDPLMALLLLPAFYFYLRFRKHGAWHLLGFALGFFFLALLSKETALALPVVVAYCELFHFKSDTPLNQRLVRTAKLMGLFAIPAVIYMVMRYQAIEALLFSGKPRYPLVPALLTVPLATVKYLGLMFIPWGYSYQHYTDFVDSPVSLAFLGPVALLIALAAAIWFLKSRRLTLGAVWFIVMLAPVLATLRQFEPAYLLQERYLYVPSIGICLAVALGFQWLAARDRFGNRGHIAWGAVAVLLVIVWGAILIRQNNVWDDSLSVYKNCVAVSPRSAIAHAFLSRSYYDTGRPREAESVARTALDLDPQCPTAYMNLSYYSRMSGKLDKACEYLEAGISAIPETTTTRHDLATMYLNLGLLYGQRKMYEIGEQKLLRSIEITPRAVAWYYTGGFYSDQGRFEDARVMYEQTLTSVPHWFAPIHMRLGLIYEALGDTSRAVMEFDKYLELAPADAPDKDNVRKHLTTLKGGGPSK